jgi:hypothetical protein
MNETQPAKERDFSCKVCGNKPNSDGELEHGKGCYTQDENGGGSEFISDAVTAPQPAQDVDYWIREATAARQAEMAMRRELEAQPAQERQWIWLSDADIRETIDSICQYNGDYDEFLCKKIERKIKELNT